MPAHLVLLLLLSAANARSANVTLAALWPLGGGGPLVPFGASYRALADLVVAECNASPDLLPNHTLVLDVLDTEGEPVTAQRRMGEVAAQMITPGGREYVGALGVVPSAVGVAVSYVATAFDIPLVSPLSTTVQLSDKAAHPQMLRTLPSQLHFADVFLDAAVRFGWRRAAFLSNDDEFGTPYSAPLASRGLELGVLVEPYLYRLSGAGSLEDALLAIRASGVLVIFAHVPPIAADAVSRAAVRLGLLGDPHTHTWVFTSLYHDNYLATARAPAAVRAAAAGSLAVVYHLPAPGAWPWLDAFAASVAAANVSLVSGRVTSLDASVRDAVLVWALALDAAARDGVPLVAASRARLMPYLAAVDTERGTTSRLSFGAGLDSLGDFDLVSLAEDVRASPTVAVYRSRGAALDFVVDPAADIVWPGGRRGPPPPDTPAREVRSFPRGAGRALIALACAGLAASLAFHVMLLACSKRPAVRASGRRLSHAILVGSDVLYAGTVAKAALPQSGAAACAVVPWTAACGLALVFGALAAKTYRIRAVFLPASLSATVPGKRLWGAVALLLAYEATVLGVWFGSADRPRPELVPYPLDDGVDVWACSARRGGVWIALLAVPIGAFAVATCVFSYQTRNVTAVFREARSIALASSSVLLLGLVAAAVLPFVRHQDAEQVVLSLFLIGSASLSIFFLFAPRLLAALGVGKFGEEAGGSGGSGGSGGGLGAGGGGFSRTLAGGLSMSWRPTASASSPSMACPSMRADGSKEKG